MRRNDLFSDRELARASREGGPLSLMIVDFDRFKHINDNYGHLAGDAVLSEAARRMRAAVRSYDSIGRYGGEEFLIVLAGCHGESAVEQAERIRHAIGGEPFPAGDGGIHVTCSIGVSSWHHFDPVDAATLMREADQALYLAKKDGRNRVAVGSTGVAA